MKRGLERSRRVMALLLVLIPVPALAHIISRGDKGYVTCTDGWRLVPFLYLGAKHMVTGYDHLLFLVGVVFFLYRMKDVALYVTLFAVGHSITLVGGVVWHVTVNAALIDAIIGLSVAYKGLDNLGLLSRWLGMQPDVRATTMFFGLCHGLGLASKLIDFELTGPGTIPNLLAFNVGVETGQIVALAIVLIAMGYWRRTASFVRYAQLANVLLILAGVGLIAMQLNIYFGGA